MNYPYQISSQEQYDEIYKKSVEQPLEFWDEIAQNFVWKQPYQRVLDWDFRTAETKWYIGGKLNITENCLDRHLAERADVPAIIFEPNNPEDHHRVLTYRELHFKVMQFAQVLKNNGICHCF